MRKELAVFLGLIPALAFAQSATTEADVRVVKGPGLQEEQPVGDYGAPEWTGARRFPTTRVYVQKSPGEMGVEQWIRSKYYEGERGKHRIQEEFEVGLPHRLQLDLYVNSEINENGTWYYDNFATELRYALADWGKIPMNPTIYGEYKIKDAGDDVAEVKLLLGDELTKGWHWGLNGVYEWELGGERAKEYGVSAAISHTLMDRKFSLGAEVAFTSESIKGDRGNSENSLNVGPSLQWRPRPQLHVDVVPLIGVTDDAPDLMTYLVVGYDFGAGKTEGLAPVSSRGR